MKKRICAFVFSLLLSSVDLFAQTGSLKESLQLINAQLGSDCRVEIKKMKLLVIDWYKNGQIFREDKVLIEEIDPETMVYSKEEQAVMLYCRAGNEECFDRKMHLTGNRRPYSRMNLLVPDENTGNELIKAFRQLIQIYIDTDPNPHKKGK